MVGDDLLRRAGAEREIDAAPAGSHGHSTIGNPCQRRCNLLPRAAAAIRALLTAAQPMQPAQDTGITLIEMGALRDRLAGFATLHEAVDRAVAEAASTIGRTAGRRHDKKKER